MKNTILAITLIIGCTSVSQAKDQDHELKECVHTFSSCTKDCNKEADRPSYSCYSKCQSTMDTCFNKAGIGGFSAEDQKRNPRDEVEADKK